MFVEREYNGSEKKKRKEKEAEAFTYDELVV